MSTNLNRRKDYQADINRVKKQRRNKASAHRKAVKATRNRSRKSQ